jgi:hypothetical protein
MIKGIDRPQRGVAMVEFAIVLPLLIALFFGIAELGRALYQQNTLYKAVIAGTRYLARVPSALDPDTCAEGSWDADVAKAKNIIIYGNPGGSGTPILPNMDPNKIVFGHHGPETLSDTITPACIITVTAEVDFLSIMGGNYVIPFSNIGPITLRAETEERFIGY